MKLSYPTGSRSVLIWPLILLMTLVMACATSSSNNVPDASIEPTETEAEATPEQQPQPTNTPKPTESDSNEKVGGGIGDEAPDFTGITAWINSEPLSIKDLRGKVVLVDVWTYTCVNCIRTFPYLKDWYAKYEDDGLVIVGLHAPEFEFEKETANVMEAANKYGIVWPVAQDNDMVTWHAYGNQFWPAKYLIDQDGIVRYTHFGEGSYAETEQFIRELLLDTGADLSDDALDLPQDQVQDTTFYDMLKSGSGKVKVTPELYAGYERNLSAVMYGADPYVVQTDYYKNRDTLTTFESPDELVPHKVYFNGSWLIEAERAKHGRETQNYEDYIAINYSAKSVNAVITSDSGEPYRVRVTMDGEYLTEENRGADVMIEESGESYILVTEPRLYAIVNNPTYVSERTLRLSPNSADFGLFAYTFGIYEEGP